MSQPMDFGFSEESAMLKDSARRWFQEKIPAHALHRLVANDADSNRDPIAKWNKALWQEMLDMGWQAISIPESLGGSGLPVVAAAGLLEESGRSACPSPLLATLQSVEVLRSCNTESANHLLKAIAEGASCALAISGQQHAWDMNVASVEATAKQNGFELNGSACYVQDAQKADWLIVKAHHGKHVELFAVNITAAGVQVVPDHIVDLTRDQAHITFNHVVVPAAARLSASGAAAAALCKAEAALLTLLSADMAGAAEWQLQTTVEYAKTRVQFDKPIGFFQAVKHPLVDLMVMIDGARALVYNAACAIDHESEKAEQYARMAKAAASDMATFASRKSIQLHGGIGFTWECFVHIYVKRQLHSRVQWGDADYQRSRLAQLIFDKT